MRRTGALALCILGFVAACAEPPPEPSQPKGGVVVREAFASFGEVVVGEEAAGEVILENRGGTSAWLEVTRPPEGFRVEPSVVEIGGGEVAAVTVYFAPRREEEVEGTVGFRTEDGELVAEVPVHGVGVAIPFSMAANVDFGRITPGIAQEIRLVLENQVDRPLRVQLRLEGDPAFSLSDEFLLLPAEGTASVSLVFRPEAPRAYEALLSASSCPTCPPRLARIRGEGKGAVAEVWPDELHFGAVPPKLALDEVVTIRNDFEAPLTFTASVRPREGAFEIVGEPEVGPLLPGEEAPIVVRFRPPGPGVHTATLRIRGPEGLVYRGQLVGVGGGPRLGADAEAIDFGTVAVGAAVLRTLRLENVGEPGLALFVESIAVDGGEEEAPIAIRTPPMPLDLAEPAEIPLWFVPRAAGTFEGSLIVKSSIPAQGEVRIPFHGSAYVPRGCSLVADPQALRFGLVGLPARRARSIYVSNVGDAPCLVDAVRIEGQGTARFELAFPWEGPRWLGPGESLHLSVLVDTEGAAEAEAVEARLLVQHGEGDAVGLLRVLLHAVATAAAVVNPPPTFTPIPPTPTGAGFVSTALFPTERRLRLAFTPESSPAFEFFPSQALEIAPRACADASCVEPVRVAFHPKNFEWQRARLAVQVEGFDEPAYFDFEAFGIGTCLNCNWPMPGSCRPNLRIEVDQFLSFATGWPWTCGWTVGGVPLRGSRHFAGAVLMDLEAPDACSASLGFMHPDVWGTTGVNVEYLQVDSEGRAMACDFGVTNVSPAGITVAVVPRLLGPLEHRVFLLRESEGDPAVRDDWFDPAASCSGPDGAHTATCTWGSVLPEDVRIVSMGAARGAVARILVPEPGETYDLAYYFEPASTAPAAALVDFHVFCQGIRVGFGTLQMAPNTVTTFAKVAVSSLGSCAAGYTRLQPPLTWPYRLEEGGP